MSFPRLRQFATQLKDKLLEAGTTIAATMGGDHCARVLEPCGCCRCE
ncbi:hypothetical protein AB0K02_14805 [Streptomyces sp. NPDC049597]